MTIVRIGVGALLSILVTVAAAQQPGPAPQGRPTPQATAKPDTPAVTRMIEQLKQDVGPRWVDTVRFWCETPRANRPDDPPVPATQILDNVYAIGNTGTTVYVVRTSAGLVMIDSLGAGDAEATAAQRESQLLPGFQKLKLDPAQVRTILVAHGHNDHFGGASYFQERYGTRVYVSEEDWKLIENPPPARGGAAPTGTPTPPPKRDGIIRDGEPIVLGDLTVTPITVPGHTPGAVAFIFPVTDQGRPHVAAVFGGAWLTPGPMSNEGFQIFLKSVFKFREAARRTSVDTMLQNHMLMVPLPDWLNRVTNRKAGEPNPFVVGAADYQKFLDVMGGCARVNLARRGL